MKALLIVDMQNDFMPKGTLAVPDGDQVVPITNQLMNEYDVVVATQDWHPRDHCSFASNHKGGKVGNVIQIDYKEGGGTLDQVLWPDHCIQDTKGAELHPDLNRQKIDAVVRKGTNPKIDAYSAFYDNGRLRATTLADYLRDRGVDEVHVAGLATDYCVKATAIDAVKEGFATAVITDATRGVNVKKGDVDKALKEMERAGVKLIESGVKA